MSVLVMAWVFAHSPTKLGDRLVLLSLADYAHDDGSRAFPSVESLATKARVGKSTARAALRRLEDEGHIRNEGAMPSGTISYRILMGAPESGGGQNRAEGGPESGANPSKEPSPQKNAGERAKAAAGKLPDDFPENLKPHARQVFAVLRRVAEDHNAREVTPRGVGLAMQGAPSKRYVAVAYELASWAAAPPRPINDVVGTYRTFLKKAETYAGVERFDQGKVVSIHGGSGGGDVLGASMARAAERNRRTQEELDRREAEREHRSAV